jgi:hypothetical protein
MRKMLTAAALAATMLAGCATYSDKIAPTYVSAVMYDNLTCRQIAEEATRVSARAAEAAGAQDSQANRDNAVTAAAIIIFWPAAFFVGGDKAQAAEVGRLKGEMNALEQASAKKQCGIQFRS